jgi:streptomycin 6-kinase
LRRWWDELEDPCPERVVEQALLFADRRAAAFDLGRCVVAHGDPHAGNALEILEPRAGAESCFVLVDPEGFLAERAYDLGVVLRTSPAARARTDCRLLAALTHVDEQAIWEWGFLERVSSGLYHAVLGDEAGAQRFLASAAALAG